MDFGKERIVTAATFADRWAATARPMATPPADVMDPIAGAWPQPRLTADQMIMLATAHTALEAAAKAMDSARAAIVAGGLPVKLSHLEHARAAIGVPGKGGYLYGLEVMVPPNLGIEVGK